MNGRIDICGSQHMIGYFCQCIDAECKKILALAKAGKMNGCLIEGMGCPGGCVAGAGTNLQVAKAQKKVKEFVAGSSKKIPSKELEEIELK